MNIISGRRVAFHSLVFRFFRSHWLCYRCSYFLFLFRKCQINKLIETINSHSISCELEAYGSHNIISHNLMKQHQQPVRQQHSDQLASICICNYFPRFFWGFISIQ